LPKKLSQNYESVKKDYRTGESLKKMLVKTSEYLATSIKSYKGLRNFSGLPSRGQRTKTNAKTKRRVGYKNYRK
jgi:ribosomal protein S13